MNIVVEIEKILKRDFPDCDTLQANLTANKILDIVTLSEREEKIRWSKDILANYEEDIFNYDEVIKDDQIMLEFAELLDSKNLEDNGNKEIEAISELFDYR